MENNSSSEKLIPSELEGLPLLGEEAKAIREPKRRMRTTKFKALSLPTDLKIQSCLGLKSYKISDEYHLMNEIGFGTYSQVKKAINKKTEQRVAIKIWKGTSSWNLLQNEAEILKQVDSEYLPKFYDFKKDETSRKSYLMMEYIEGKSLDVYIKENGTMKESEANKFLLMLIKAVNELHSKGIAHRDIKPQNILITEDKKIKLIDFNISKKMKERGSGSEDANEKFKWVFFTQISSPMYAAPEISSLDCYTESIDIWGIGVAYAEMLYKVSELIEDSKSENISKVLGNVELINKLSDENMARLKSMLSLDPELRPTICDLLNQFSE